MKKFVAGSVIALGFAHGAAVAAPTLQVKGSAGQSLLTLNKAFLGTMEAAGVGSSAIKPAKRGQSNGRLRFPVAGGVIDLSEYSGEITHTGGFRLEGLDGTRVAFHNLSLEMLGETLRISGVVEIDGNISDRIPVFDVILVEDSEISISKSGKLVSRKIALAITQETSDLLNSELGLFVPTGDEVASIRGTAKLVGYKNKENKDKDDSDDSDDDDSDDDDSDDSDDDDSDDDDSDDSDDDDSDDDD